MSAGVRLGYKQTEVGEIPEDWEVKRLGEFASFRTGPFGSAIHKSDYVSGGTPIVNPMHIVGGSIKPTDSMAVSGLIVEKLKDFRLKEKDIVIGRRGEMGRCAVVLKEQDGWLCGTGSMIIKLNKTNPDFIQRILSTKKVIEAIEDS
ncbi:restriction endonuclease subunit S, partial [Deinococcus sp.]|uniref:restriction endonuclease subunit S n=1 Tax=Deinococcus sp. TaxID=47478 RepID=UPI0025C1DDEA